MLITKSLLSQAGKNFVENRSSKAMDEALGQAKRASRFGEITVFLSHKHDEVKELHDAIALLNSLGVSVYVDWTDKGMPSVTSGDTAIRIKDKIKANKKFVLLATDGAIASKWCNWELGYGDAHKYVRDITILPIAENDGTWRGNEYLQIYSWIESTDKYVPGNYFVIEASNRMPLSEWLRR